MNHLIVYFQLGKVIIRNIVDRIFSSSFFLFTFAFRIINWVFNAIIRIMFDPIIKLLNIFIVTPSSIIFRTTFQYSTLPINIPLRIFFKNTVQDLYSTLDTKESIHLLIVFSQYSFVLFLFGSIIGLCLGSILGLLHSAFRIPNTYIDFPRIIIQHLPDVRKRITKLRIFILEQFKNTIRFNNPFYSNSQNLKDFTVNTGLDSNLTPPSTPSPLSSNSFEMTGAYNNYEDLVDTIKIRGTSSINSLGGRGSVSSKEEALELASILPSNFFQKNSNIKSKIIRPSQAESNITRSNLENNLAEEVEDEDDDEEDTSVSNIWDRFDGIPSTLRTENEEGTFTSRHNTLSTNESERLILKKLKLRKKK